MYQPIQGIRVLDCTRLLPYHYCTMMLGDLGAEVLKVEEPGEGDYGRWGDSEKSYESTAFLLANRNKKSMKLNLKDARGKEIFKKLASNHDVLIESFRPGVMARLGLGYPEIQKINPAIIYCSATGYGQTGPYRDRAGHDMNYLGISGILAWTGVDTERPVIPGIPVSDMVGGGIFPVLAILAALLGRERTGRGQYIDVAQADVMVSLNIRNIADVLAVKKGQKARPVNLRGLNLCYNTFKTRDGKFLALAPVEPKFWENFCRAVGREDWISNHMLPYETGSQATEELKDLLAGKTRKEWVEIFEQIDACVTPILTPEETLLNQQVIAREMITTLEDSKRGETLQIGFPAKFSEGLDYKRFPAPFFGEQTQEILTHLGYTTSEIEELQQAKVI